MSKTQKIEVFDREIAIQTRNKEDYICITDIDRYKEPGRTDHIIQNWLRNRNTIEFLGIWEQLNNSGFKPLEFDGFKNQSGLNSFTLTPSSGLKRQALLVFFPRRVATGEPLRTRISPLSLHHGYPLNLSSILSRNSNGSKRMNESSSTGISRGIWPCISSSIT